MKEVINPLQVIQMFETDFSGRVADSHASVSQDDIAFLKKMKEGTCQTEDGHYQMPLPFQENTPKLPNNKSLALQRLLKLQSRLKNDATYHRDYTEFMQDIIERGYAEKVSQEQRHVEDGRQCTTLTNPRRSGSSLIAAQHIWGSHLTSTSFKVQT